jgi:hypothetical protein
MIHSIKLWKNLRILDNSKKGSIGQIWKKVSFLTKYILYDRKKLKIKKWYKLI